MNKKEEKIIMGAINRLVVCGAISVATILLTKDIIIFGILFASSTVINLGYGVTQSIKENKKRKQSIKNNYPYVDLSIERGELERALTREKILTTEYFENIGCFKLDVESYEKRLEEEKIRLEDLKGLNHFTETYVGPATKAMAEHFSNIANTEDDEIGSEILINQTEDKKEKIYQAIQEEKNPMLTKINREVLYMEKQIINITDEQRKNLVNEMATLVAKMKKKQEVECIYFAPYKVLGYIKGNVLDFTMVIKGYSEKVKQEFSKYDKLFQDDDLIRKFGIKIHVNADDSRKYATLPLNPSETLRANCLFNSVILFDRTGEYSKMKQETQEHVDIPNSNVFKYENLAEIFPPIEELIKMELETQDVKEFTKTKTFELIKNML